MFKHFSCLLFFHLLYFPLYAETYYISLSGNDTNLGTSPNQAWASIEKVNATIFLPGDTILFEGGSVFEGGIYFYSKSGEKGKISRVVGTPEKPIVFSSYGTGKAVIESDTVAGFKVYNGAGFVVKNLNFIGAGWDINSSFGVEFYMDIPDTLLEYVLIENVEVTGYREAGISIASWDQTTGGFKDVSIINCISRDNGDAGIATYARGLYCHKNVYVGNTKAYNNLGLPQKWWSHSGNGIVLGGVDGGVIEYCEGYNNGGKGGGTAGGPVGIWGYDSNNLIIQYNESHHNKTDRRVDGGGFDLEGCTNSIMQYNYSHHNEGNGYMVGHYGKALTRNIIIRFNISENDVRRTTHGAVHLYSNGPGGMEDIEIYNNTIFISDSSTGAPKAFGTFDYAGLRNVRVYNNNFQTSGIKGRVKVIHADKTEGLLFLGNNYWTSENEFIIRWADEIYYSLESWQKATGQEMFNAQTTGYSVDPQLIDPGRGITISDPSKLYTLRAYELQKSSPLIGQALDLKKNFGIDPGHRDFFGNSIEDRHDLAIGAHQPTPRTKACLQGGPILLVFGQEAEGWYSGDGLTEGNYIDPAIIGEGIHPFRYHFINEAGEEQVVHHSMQVMEAASTAWEGKDPNWLDSDNWSACVPTPFIDVTIPEPVGNGAAPVIKSDQQAAVRDLHTAIPLVIESEGTLAINGTFSGPPIEADPLSTVIISGNVEQQIPTGTFGKLQLKGNGSRILSGAIAVSRELELKEGKLILGDHSLTIESTGSIPDPNEGSYIVTDGLGTLTYNAIGEERTGYFPIGTFESYTPAIIENKGEPDNFSLRVADGGQSTGPQLQEGMVNKIWHIEENIEGGSDVKLILQWNEQDEPEHFLRSRSFISHYQDGRWVDPQEDGGSAADDRQEDAYTQSLDHIRSFSAFGVGSSQEPTAVYGAVKEAGIIVWPNPFSEALSLEINLKHAEAVQLRVTDVLGQLVSEKNISLQPGENTLDISLDDKCSAGLYILSVSFGGETQQIRVVRR